MKPGKESLKLRAFVTITWDMLNSKAYKQLSYSASKALPYFMGKPKKHMKDPDYYSVEITFSYSEGKRYGFSSATFSKVIQDLVKLGFIDPVEKGGLRGSCKSTSKFRISDRWKKFDKGEFKNIDWKQFSTDI